MYWYKATKHLQYTMSSKQVPVMIYELIHSYIKPCKTFFFNRDGNEESFVQSYIALVPNNESRLDTELDNSHLTVKELTKREKDRMYKREQRANKEYRFFMIIYTLYQKQRK